jgi:hypothetical protein
MTRLADRILAAVRGPGRVLALVAGPTRTDRARAALGAVGIGFGLWGAWLLLQSLSAPALLRLPLWLGGAVLVDDLVLVPVTIAVGWALTRWSVGRRERTVDAVRTMLLYVGVTTLIALPLLLRQGEGANPTVLPRDYLRDWLVLEAGIVLAGLVWLLATAARHRSTEPDEPGGRG